MKTFALGYVGITDAARHAFEPRGRQAAKMRNAHWAIFHAAWQEKGDTHFVLPHISRKKSKRRLLPLSIS